MELSMAPAPKCPDRMCLLCREFYRASFVDAYAQDLEDMRTAANVRPVKPELLLKCMQVSIHPSHFLGWVSQSPPA